MGSGKSGIGAAGLLGKIGALPVIFDSNEKLCATDIKEKAGHIPELEVRIGLIPEEEKRICIGGIKSRSASRSAYA